MALQLEWLEEPVHFFSTIQLYCSHVLCCCTMADPIQIFFCNPVVLESIWYHTKANWLKKESNTTGGLKKIRRGSALFWLHCENKSEREQITVWAWETHILFIFRLFRLHIPHISVGSLSYDSRSTLIRTDGWKKLDGLCVYVFLIWSYLVCSEQ